MLKKITMAALLASAAAFGTSTQAYADADAYAFAYTYAPYDTGETQELILNGTTVLQATNTGWYDYTGFHQAANPDYIVGNCSIGTCGGNAAYNNFFVFDLSSVTGPITSAALSLGNPGLPYPGYSGAPSVTYTNYDVSTPISTLIADNTGATDIYADLGSGQAYASTMLSAADNGTQVAITLDSAAIADLTAAEGGQFAIGGTLGTFSGGAAVPEPATWAMMLFGMGAVGYAMRRRHNVSVHYA